MKRSYSILSSVFLTALFLLAGSIRSSAATFYVLPRAGSDLAAEIMQEGDPSLDVLPYHSWRSILPEDAVISQAFPGLDISANDRIHRWAVLNLDDQTDPQTVQRFLLTNPSIEAVDTPPVRTLHVDGLDQIPADPLVGYQWHLTLINAFTAWDIVPDASGIVIALPDIGVDMEHIDIHPVLWANESEIYGTTGVDDDNNGFIDDYRGWDFHSNDNDPSPVSASDVHGTHAAGIAAAAHDNRIGISGVAPGARIMAVRAGEGRSISNGFDAILYAANNGADVISMSWGGYNSSLVEHDVIRYALSQGCVIVASAGNESRQDLEYPAAYEDVISVAAVDIDHRLASFSNRGTWVDIAAPGVNIFSTVIDGYGFLDGTSMAAPIVAGVACLVRAQEPDLTPAQVRSRLGQGALPITSQPDNYVQSGIVNAWCALCDEQEAISITNVEFTDESGDGIIEPGEDFTMDVEWEVFGDDADMVRLRMAPYDDSIIGSTSQDFYGITAGSQVIATFDGVVNSNTFRGTHFLGLATTMGFYSDTLEIRVPVAMNWRTHNAGDMVASVTDFGAIGYYDYRNARELPDGVRLVDNPKGFLYHGSLMVSDGSDVADCAYGNQWSSQYDFETDSNGIIHQANGSTGQQVFEASYSDTHVGTGVQVNQCTISYPEGDNFVIMDFDISRIIPGSANYTVGLYMDWDIFTSIDNQVGYDSDLRLSYIYNEHGAGGIVALDEHTITGVRAISNEEFVYNGFSDEDKLMLMQDGVANAESDEVRDWSHMVAVDAGYIPVGESQDVQFAIVAAENVQLLREAANAAYSAFSKQLPGTHDETTELPTSFRVFSPWPNPFNQQTRVQVELPDNGDLTIEIINVLGQQVAVLADGNYTGGQYDFTWHPEHPGSGIYFLRTSFENRIITRKLLYIQ